MADIRSLLLLLIQKHADLIESVLPPEDRARWRQVVMYVRARGAGPKPRDDRGLLLAMAELELTGASDDVRGLAMMVTSRLPAQAGASNDERAHVLLPDESAPARRDLIDRLEKKYIAERSAILRQVSAAQEQAARVGLRVDRILTSAAKKPRRKSKPYSPDQLKHLKEAARRLEEQPPTAYGVDLALKAAQDRLRQAREEQSASPSSPPSSGD